MPSKKSNFLLSELVNESLERERVGESVPKVLTIQAAVYHYICKLTADEKRLARLESQIWITKDGDVPALAENTTTIEAIAIRRNTLFKRAMIHRPEDEVVVGTSGDASADESLVEEGVGDEENSDTRKKNREA